MACQDISHSWTLSGLLGAFLHLAVAYFLLCCSAVIFFIASFLGFFGFSLYCPCNGLYGLPYRGPCLQSLLLRFPAQTVSSLQFYVKGNFPFHEILPRSDHCQLNLKLVRERRLDDGRIELEAEAEASYSSSSDPRRSQQSFSGSDSIGKNDFKGKALRQSYGLRSRPRASIDYSNFTSSSFYDHPGSDENVRVLRRSPSVPNNLGSKPTSQKLMPLNLPDSSTVSRSMVPDVEPGESNGEKELMYKSASSLENLKNSISGEDENAVRILEYALEEEQAARVALCSELEQERIAAASAADEAMAMISRLQVEKASIEIEARQYQRILEEKSAYDAEEMNILKEIIIMREREKHFLEKEAEAYRNILQDNEGLTREVSDAEGLDDAFVLNSSVDPMLMLQQLNESLDKRGSLQDRDTCFDYASGSVRKQTCTPPVSEQLAVMEFDDQAKMVKGIDSPDYSSIVQENLQNGDESSQDIQEKGMLSIDEIQCLEICRSTSSPNSDFQGESTIVGETQQNDDVYLLQNVLPGMEKVEGVVVTTGASEPHVHDVHIIDSKRDIVYKSATKRGDPLLLQSNSSNVSRKFELQLEASNFQRADESATNSLKGEMNIGRTRSDTVLSFSTVSSSPSRSFISAVDHERLRIDSEIGWLRERLKAVQEEKEKISNSLESRERGRSELQLLQDIAAQVREIRNLTEPEKASRHALPPLSSKVTSKKRRSRSISGGVYSRSAST